MRGKNKKEIVGGFFNKVTKSADELLLSGQKDIDEQFEQDKLFLVEYHKKIASSTELADKMTKTTKSKWMQVTSRLLRLRNWPMK